LTGTAETSRPSPRNGLAAYRCSPRGTAFLAPVVGGTYRQRSARVAAPGPHDFAGRCQRFVYTVCTALTPQRPIATRTPFRDDREASLMVARAGGLIPQIRIPVKRNTSGRQSQCCDNPKEWPFWRLADTVANPDHSFGNCPSFTMIGAHSGTGAGQGSVDGGSVSQDRRGIRGAGAQLPAPGIGLHPGAMGVCCGSADRDLSSVLRCFRPLCGERRLLTGSRRRSVRTRFCISLPPCDHAPAPWRWELRDFGHGGNVQRDCRCHRQWSRALMVVAPR